MKKQISGILQVILSQFLIGFLYIFVKLGGGFGVYNLVFFRVLLAFLFLGVLFIFSRKFYLVKLNKSKYKMFFFGFLHAITIILSFISINNLSVSLAVLLTATISIWMVIFSHILLKEKINYKIVYSIILSFIGLLLVVEFKGLSFNSYTIGVITGLLVGCLGGFIYAFSKTFKEYDGISLTFWQNLIATPFLIPLLLIESPSFTPYNIIIVLGIGIVGISSFVFLYSGLKLIKGQVGGVLTLLSILFTMLFGFLFFGEVLTQIQFIGAILIVLGCYIATKVQ